MESNLTRNLSPSEARVVLTLEWEEQGFASRQEIVRLLGRDARAADRVIHSLRRKRWLERLGRGRYRLIPASRGPEGIPDANLLVLAEQFIKPSYVAFSSAAAYHGLTTQARGVVWVATLRQLRSRTFQGTTFRFVQLARRKFFGYEGVRVYGAEVSMSDREKTILDCVDHLVYGGGIGEVARMLAVASPRMRWDTLGEYAVRMRSVAATQRLGYLCDRLGIRIPDAVRLQLRSLLKPSSRSFLDSVARWGKTARYDAEWQVLLNVPDRAIFSEL